MPPTPQTQYLLPLNDTLTRTLTFLILSLLLISTHGSQVFTAEPFLDDGIPLYSEALCEGWRSLFNPLAGSLLLIERLIFLIGSILFPLKVFSFGLISVALFRAWIYSRIVLSRYHWLVPSVWGRIFLALCFAFGPGTVEISHTVMSLVYPFAFYTFLILAEEKVKLKWPELLTLSMFALSSAPLSVFVVLAVTRWFLSKERSSSLLIVGGICSANLALQGALTFFSGSSLAQSSIASLTLLPLGVLDRLGVYVVSVPLFGPVVSSFLVEREGGMHLLLLVFIALSYFVFRKARFRRTIDWSFFSLLLGSLLTLSFFFALHVLFRSYSLSPSQTGTIHLGSRYYYLGFHIGIVIFAGLLVRVWGVVQRKLVLFVIGILLLLNQMVLMYSSSLVMVRRCPEPVQRFLAELNSSRENGSLESRELTLPIGPYKETDEVECQEKNADRVLLVTIKSGKLACGQRLNPRNAPEASDLNEE